MPKAIYMEIYKVLKEKIETGVIEGDGVMFEYTQSRHRPDYFRFQENATRRMG